MMGVDPRRFGPYASRGYLHREERGGLCQGLHRALSGRRARRRAAAEARRPAMTRMKALGAVFGTVYGWERPNWFAPQGLWPRRRPTRQARRAAQREPSRRGGRRAAAREMELPPLQLFRVRRQRVPQRARERGPHGHVGLRQVRGLRAGRRSLARFHPGQPHPEDDRPRRAELSADQARRRARGVHR